MSKNRTGIRRRLKKYLMKYSYIICIGAAVLLFLLSLVTGAPSRSTEHLSARVEKRIDKRMKVLDEYMDRALKADRSQWLILEDIPEDMVVYRYVYDTLQSWCNQFPVMNDDLGSKLIFHRFTNLRTSLTSPLSEVTGEARYMNIGPKWYIVKSADDGVNCKIIAGLEIKNTMLEGVSDMNNGLNPNLKIPAYYNIYPLNEAGGDAVCIGGVPMFKLTADWSHAPDFFANSLLRWIAIILILTAAVLYLWGHRNIKSLLGAIATLIGLTILSYSLGRQVNLSFFSPTVYAGGQFLYSFGALIIINAALCLYVICIFLMRKYFMSVTIRKGTFVARMKYATGIILTIAAICIYSHLSLKSLIFNSNILLELYMWNEVTIYTFVVYLSYSSLFFAVLLLVQMLKPVFLHQFGIRYNAFSKKFLLGYAVLCSAYLTAIVGITGFQKEQNRIEVLSNRLAVDRDLGVELQLRSVENDIANDPFIASLTGEGVNSNMILNRLTDNYLSGLTQNWDIAVTVCRDSDRIIAGRFGQSINCLDYFNTKVRNGSPVADNSRFIYTNTGGTPCYTGMFIFYSEKSGIVRMFIEVKPKSFAGNKGYASVPGLSSGLGSITIPPSYSYAKYISGKLVTSHGNYAYPTVITGNSRDESLADEKDGTLKRKKFLHFVNWISEDEAIVVSRPVRGMMVYLVTFSYLLLITYGSIYVFSKKPSRRSQPFKKNYYRTRINTVLSVALFLTLIVMTIASVTFVYNRNEINMNNLMSGKISTIQAMLEPRTRYISDWNALNSQEFTDIINEVGNMSKADLNFYTPGGRIFKSTSPEIVDRMVLGSRINQDAYYNIVYGKQKFYINRESYAGHKFYSLYAPLFNEDGKMIAIINSPYTDQGYDFKRDAFFHSATIINLFLILLIATIVVSTSMVNAMFKPIVEMGKKMNSTDIHGLEYIIYKREDEISTLVEAYNRMVHDLSMSAKQLAQAERDKAWSEMARQVAHEIKNPLTPMKMKLQMLQMLKKRNDPSWQEKFDEVSRVVLEQIDNLAYTANEFSSFAKLYSEEHVLVDLDEIIKDQLIIFDNRENIEFSYMGLDNALVMAPKPQLIRVFVNLLTNAVQAIEIMQQEQEKEGKPVVRGRIGIFTRNSVRDGYYDVVIEDNGPGVKEENLGKLFSPNFTTKSSGTGLGLAICRNIIEMCNGEIFYQRGFVLKGASFTVRLPKKQ